MTHSPTLLLVDALAVARLTRLVIADTILEPVRNRLRGRKPSGAHALSGDRIIVAARPKLAEFIVCPWCISFWAAVGVVALQAAAPGVCLPVTAVLAFSLVGSVVHQLADRA